MKKIFCLFAIALLLCGCEKHEETVPAAAYITTEKNTESVTLTCDTTVKSASEIEITSAITTETTTTTTTTTSAATTEASEITAETTARQSEEKQTETPAETTVTTQTTAQTKPPKPLYTNKIYLNGPNLVYTGDSFQFTYKISHKNADRATILWKCDGDAGTLTEDGLFTAKKKGLATLTVTDISNGLTDTLTVHVVDSADEVDFVTKVNGIPIANKTYPVPKNYNPGLDPDTYAAFIRLREAALAEGLDIFFMSGFRSYEDQQRVYKGWVEKYGEEADRVSARPGHSEHQLGLAIDVNSIEFSFADTPEGQWLAENCWKYGFIIRYKKETESITGYMYEPWHIRYLGDIAEEVHFSGLTLEEYLGIDSVYRDPFKGPREETE